MRQSSSTLAETKKPLHVAGVLHGKRIVILGGTGFLGKIYWSMLLARFPNIGKIYLLVRSSRTKTSEQRFWDEVAPSEAFQPLKDQYGEGYHAFLREHIVPIDGDVGRPNCGFSPELIATLKDNVDAVVNVAGVVDFNPPLDEALDTNAFGAQNLIDLVRQLGTDVPLMHTSTCYVVGNRKGLINEDVPWAYPFPRCEELGRELWDPEAEIRDCLDLIAQARGRAEDAFRQSVFQEQAKKNLIARSEPTAGRALDEEVKNVKRRFIEGRLVEAGLERATHWGWPNIYTYTKSIGEQIIARSGVRYVIGRPACCESTIEYPFPAWNEGLGTSAPIIYLVMKGHRQIIAPPDTVIDFVPSDIVCAGMILTLAELIEGTSKPVYQYGTSDSSPMTMERIVELTSIYKRRYFARTNKGHPLVNLIQAQFEAAAVTPERFDAIGPGKMAKGMRALGGMLKRAPGPMAAFGKAANKTLENAAKTEEKIDEIMRLFSPFTGDQKGPFSCDNTRSAYARLSDEERALLPWHPEDVNWSDYWMDQHMPAMEKRVIPWLDERYKKEQKPLKAHETIGSLVSQLAERNGHRVAFQRAEPAGLTRITFEDVERRSRAGALALQAQGVERGDRIVLSAKNHTDWPIAYFSIVRAGATCVPVDADIEPTPFANIVNESGAKVLLLDAHVEKRVTSALASFDLKRTVIAPQTLTEDPGSMLGALAQDLAGEDDVASLIFTSGTTGTPKGVRLSHKNLLSMIAALAPLFPLTDRDRILSVLPLHHTFEFSCGLLLPFSRSARVVYIDELTSDRLRASLRDGKITGMVGVPAVWQLLERRILQEVRKKGDSAETVFRTIAEINRKVAKYTKIDLGRALFAPVHDSLGGNIRFLISGGASLPADTHKLFAGLGLKLTEGYGLTEAAPVLTVAKAGTPAGQVGKPVPGVTIRIDSPDASGVGEVLARGPNIMLGYTSAEATKAVLDDNGWLHTGDLGKLDSRGQLTIVGRAKDVIVTAGGENIYPDDLETQLGKIAHIEEYAFVGLPKEGGGERLCVLAVIEKDDAAERKTRIGRAEKALRDALANLPYGKQPSLLQLVDTPLPRTATKKVKRNDVKELLQRLARATRSGSVPGSGDNTPVRAALASLRNKIGGELTRETHLADDLGFDSLAMSELLVALEAKYGTLDPKELAKCVNVGEVEDFIGGHRESQPPRALESMRSTRRIEGREAGAEGSKREPIVLPREVQEAGKNAIGALQSAFYGGFMDSSIYGRAFIPHNRATIVVANHASHLDMGFVRHALGKYGEDIVSLAAADYFFERDTVMRAFFENFTNLRAFDRKGGLRASERQAAEILQAGRTMLVFPEATRSPDGDIHEFKSLVGHLALRYEVDILPVYLGGTRAAMPKGATLPRGRKLTARIGPVLALSDMRRLTNGMTIADASREVAKMAHRAVCSLRDGSLLDLSRVESLDDAKRQKTHEHPLVALFEELNVKFKPGAIDKPVSFYFTLGGDALSKWTVNVDGQRCEIKNGKPDSGTADCVLKTTPEIFSRIVRNSFVPGAAEFLSGQVKSNDVELLFTFQKVFELS